MVICNETTIIYYTTMDNTVDVIHMAYRQTGASTPADLVYWMFIQTGRRSDPGLELVLSLAASMVNNCC